MLLGRVIGLLILFCFVNGACSQYTDRAKADQISIGGLPGITFNYTANQFSGYLKADAHKHLYYWYVESQRDPAGDPLVIWVGGGPGCTALYGMLLESGPFHTNRDGSTLFENIFSWNKVANVVYLESPISVGYSYSDLNSTYSGDQSNAVDNYNAIVDFFNDVFPTLKTRALYIAGQSYAGAYIPVLTIEIIKGIKRNAFPGNFQGIIIGNGVFSERRQHNSLVSYMYYHGLIGSELWKQLKDACCPTVDMSQCNFWAHMRIIQGSADYVSDNTLCGNLTWLATEWYPYVDRYGNNEYNIYLDCYHPHKEGTDNPYQQNEPNLPVGFTNGANQNYDSTDSKNGFDCWGSTHMKEYLNRETVQRALHVVPPYGSLPMPWTGCSDALNFNRTVYELDDQFAYILQNSNISILIHNGDVDLVCNSMMAEWFVNDMTRIHGLQMHGERKSWQYRGRTSGYQRIFDRIHHLIVKGSGHMVNQYRPAPAFQMFANFLAKNTDYSLPANVSLVPRPLLPQYQGQLYK